jgi:3-hydroxyisobutyrate dehydrogenase
MAGRGTVGFVGLGRMGRPMAANLARAGYELVVRDAAPERQRRFAAEHACSVAEGPADFAGASVVVTMLPTEADVRDALLGEGGLAPALVPGSIVVDMSSSAPQGTRETGALLAGLGVALVDAPVSGGVPKAEEGTLTIMLGGDDEAAIARALPVVEALGERVFRTGSLGTGHAMKALNNFVAAAGFTAAAEALLVGRRFGLEPAVMVEVLNASTGRNFSTEFTLVSHVLPRTFATGFALGLMTKDVGIAAGLADAVAVESPLSHLVRDRLAAAADVIGPDVDHSAAVLAWEREAGVELPVMPA